jgi:AcrR family transcriptional regulator
MQRRLLDATVASLFEQGYSATTTLEVQQRAGVSRGALLHHYGSRADLMLAAVDHLGRQRVDELVRLAQAAAPRTGRIEWAVKEIWSTFQGPLFIASLELWLAARHDSDLLAALLPKERVLGQMIRTMAREIFGPTLRAAEEFDDVVELLLDAMRGASSRSVLRSDRSDARLLRSWTRLVESRLAPT